MDRNTARRGITLMVVSLTAIMILAYSLSINLTPASAGANQASPLCGAGSAPDYGFNEDLQQAHWTVNWQEYVSEQTVNKVDVILDSLNADSIVQTMILFQPQERVANRVNCAVHFLRYMKLGLPSGERKDNGFVFLIVVEPDRIDVHYGVGLGLPALTAPDLTNLNRTAEETYQSTHSLDQALLSLVQAFDTLARSKYEPLSAPLPAGNDNNSPSTPDGPVNLWLLCCQVCVGILVLLFLLWLLPRLARNGIYIGPSDFGSGGGGFSLGGGGGRGGGGGGGRSRGGSGSGRSGRGN